MKADKLQRLQEEMQLRWDRIRSETRERINRKFAETRAERSAQAEARRQEIAQNSARRDHVCPYCRSDYTTMSVRTGLLHPCSACRNLLNRIRPVGISLQLYFKLFREQGGRCAICDNTLKAVQGRPAAEIDTNNDTPKLVRGLICVPCGGILSRCRRNHEFFENAAKYLKHNAEERRWWVQKYQQAEQTSKTTT